MALVLGVVLIGYWALAPSSTDAPETFKSTPIPTPKITATTIQTPKVTLAGGASALSNSGGGSWQYYKEISIAENSGSTLTAYQVLIELKGADFPSEAQSDGADIRFTYFNDNELNYWIEDWNYAGKSAKIWVKVPNIPAGSSTTIRIYYGNPSASTTSDGNKVFEFFDDFAGTTLDTNKWAVNAVNNIVYSISNGRLRITDATTSSNTYWIYDNTDTGSQHQAKYGIVDNVIVEWKGYAENTGDMGQVGLAMVDSSNFVRAYMFYADGGGGQLAPYRGWINEKTFNNEVHTLPWSDDFKIERFGSGVKFYINSTLKTTGTLTGAPTKIAIAAGTYGGYAFRVSELDNIRTRKYTSSEPTPTLGAEQPVPTPTPTPTSTLEPTPVTAPVTDQKTLTNSIGMEFITIPAGEFDMGSPENEAGRWDSEGPVHRVKISKAFYMGKYEVTQKQWREVMGNNPSNFKGDNLPVEEVFWNDAQEFIKKLNEKEGANKYRLPSEAEWEYAARAGTTTRYSFGDDESKLGEYAWYDGNSGYKTHEVGQKKPNPWGLYDMYGNVDEWVQDIYHDSYEGAPTDGSAWEGVGSYRVFRGGYRSSLAGLCRSANRAGSVPGSRGSFLGFRLLRIS